MSRPPRFSLATCAGPADGAADYQGSQSPRAVKGKTDLLLLKAAFRSWNSRAIPAKTGVVQHILQTHFMQIVTKEAQAEEPHSHLDTDGLGVPWFVDSDQRTFMHSYFIPKTISKDGQTYVPKMNGTQVEYHHHASDAGMQVEYPQPTFDRRLTLNNWRTLLIECFSDAALRLTNLLANLQLAFSMFENAKYDCVPAWIKFLFSGLFLLAIILWIILGWRSQRSYTNFIHPDNRFQTAYAFLSAVILDMFAIPKDVLLLPLHLVPLASGGLLAESGHILGEKDWPVHTICHQNKLDHDYVNTSGISVQLPLFILVDIGCSIINVSVSFYASVFNYTALLQVASSFGYSFLKIRQAWSRRRVRRLILDMWLKTACDPCMKQLRRQNAVNKYLGAGGNEREIVTAVARSGLSDRHTRLEESLKTDVFV